MGTDLWNVENLVSCLDLTMRDIVRILRQASGLWVDLDVRASQLVFPR